MSAALLVGTALAVGALAFVLYPLFFPPTAAPARGAVLPGTFGHDEDAAIAALREIEFDRATGKLSDADYADLRARYAHQALAALRRRRLAATHAGGPEAAGLEEEIEAAVRAYRATHPDCPECGPRPESDAVFCSTCGRRLHAA